MRSQHPMNQVCRRVCQSDLLSSRAECAKEVLASSWSRRHLPMFKLMVGGGFVAEAVATMSQRIKADMRVARQASR